MSSNRHAQKLVPFALGLVLAGCAAEPIVGSWESPDATGLDGDRNEMKIDEDLGGEGRLYFAIEGHAYYADFELEATPTDRGYDIDWSCDGDCGDLDFTMQCEVTGDEDDALECEGDELWRNYEFEWEKDG